MEDRRVWNFKFGLEVSARYHGWMRAEMEKRVRALRAVSFIGAVLGVLFAFTNINMGSASVWWVGIGAALIGIANLVELVANFDGQARVRTDLYRRFRVLQAQ